ncbi:catalase-like domain-containing protein [Aspergillus leporis]|uniref:Catalase-like domain-containing protein n=1 Tax=Aspergillus leporis TaxID=41062 RepID=A0A5N5XFA3_9EURO|nr:catalase-like domain-containing protein [Aspergillus leporis]
MAERYYTLAEGCPFASNSTSIQLRNGSGGGLSLLQDTQLIETLAHFSRERIPERVVHAKAAGFLSKPGKKSPVLLRVSTVGPEAGSADTTRDVHGWAMKTYTDEGNLDWVFNNTPVFFVRDPIKFPSLNRSHKRHPTTHLPDANMCSPAATILAPVFNFFSFHVGNPEGIHELLHLFSDRGTPRSIRHMNAYSGHTYKFTKEDGSFKYVKIHIKTAQGIQNMTREESIKIAGENPDYLIQDMFEAIEKGDYPVWNVYVQVMDPSEAEKYRWNIFDMTKVWSHKDFPLRQIGRLTMNRNPRNYFADIEQAAFSPSTLVPGIAPSADPMLQARMFAYPDAARYRLGVNYQQLPTNAAKAPVYCPYQRDGAMRFDDNYGGDPNYVGSSLQPTRFYQEVKGTGANRVSVLTEHEKWVGEVTDFQTHITDNDFVQPAGLWEVIGKEPGHQERTVGNLAAHLKSVRSPQLRSEVYALFGKVNRDLGENLRKVTEAALVSA